MSTDANAAQAAQQDDDLDFGTDFDEAGTPVASTDEQTTTDTEAGDVPATGEAVEPTSNEQADAEAAATAEKAAAEKAEQEATEKAYLAQIAAFEKLVEDTLTSEDVDKATSTLPVALESKIKEAYAELPGARGKGHAQKFLMGRMQEKMAEGGTNPDAFWDARLYMNLATAVKGTKSAGTGVVAKPKVDPTEAFAARAAALMLSVNLLVKPEDVEDTWADKANALTADEKIPGEIEAYLGWLNTVPAEGTEKPEAPKVSDIIVAAAKIAAGRAVSTKAPRAASTGGSSTPRATSTGPNRNIGTHIKEAFDSVASGTFLTIADITKFESAEYGNDHPSPGAVAARLFPKSGTCTLDFVRPEGPDQGRQVKGAVKL